MRTGSDIVIRAIHAHAGREQGADSRRLGPEDRGAPVVLAGRAGVEQAADAVSPRRHGSA